MNHFRKGEEEILQENIKFAVLKAAENKGKYLEMPEEAIFDLIIRRKTLKNDEINPSIKFIENCALTFNPKDFSKYWNNNSITLFFGKHLYNCLFSKSLFNNKLDPKVKLSVALIRYFDNYISIWENNKKYKQNDLSSHEVVVLMNFSEYCLEEAMKLIK